MKGLLALGLMSTASANVNATAANFDVRTKWPGCSSQVLNQGGCGSCWAFGAAEAMSDRWCVLGHNVILSPQALVSCGGGGSCNGGNSVNAYKYASQVGLPTCTNQCTAGCEPYTSGAKNASCTADPNNDRCHGCDKQCHNGAKATKYKVAASSIVECKLDTDQTKMMAEIQAHGSVTGGLSVYSNWQGWVKNHGPDKVYDSHEGSDHLGAHAIKIIGFGTSLNQPYWLVQNSWGDKFGDKGTIKMLRGENPSIPGGDRMIWDTCQYATPSTGFEQVESSGLEDATDMPGEITGGWHEGDVTHPHWVELAKNVYLRSKVQGDFVRLERVESQVVAGFNARFTLVSTAGVRAVIFSSHGIDNEILRGPKVESLVSLH